LDRFDVGFEFIDAIFEEATLLDALDPPPVPACEG